MQRINSLNDSMPFKVALGVLIFCLLGFLIYSVAPQFHNKHTPKEISKAYSDYLAYGTCDEQREEVVGEGTDKVTYKICKKDGVEIVTEDLGY